MQKKIIILNLETTTKNCSVAVSVDGELLELKEINEGSYAHAEFLNPFIDEILQTAGLKFSDISAVAISKGPGSYTGLRIGVSAAKGLCFALDIPLIAIETLEILAKSIPILQGFIVPILDARRMEVYRAVYDSKYKIISPTDAIVISTDTLDALLEKGEVHFVGDAVEKCKPLIQHPNAVFHENTFPSAKDLCLPAYQRFLNNTFEDVAYFEPYYLKDFIVIKKV
jgi:tRNA threonylcarbamoyladenosine biosynthesis protein TsaB